MKAEIDAQGILTITAENGIEQYALRVWSEAVSKEEWPKALVVCWADQKAVVGS